MALQSRENQNEGPFWGRFLLMSIKSNTFIYLNQCILFKSMQLLVSCCYMNMTSKNSHLLHFGMSQKQNWINSGPLPNVLPHFHSPPPQVSLIPLTDLRVADWLGGSDAERRQSSCSHVQMALSQIPFHWQKVFSSSTPPRVQDVLWGRGITCGLTSSICAAADVWRLKHRGQNLHVCLLCSQHYLFYKCAVFSHTYKVFIDKDALNLSFCPTVPRHTKTICDKIDP